jgi:hypothetical protein
MTVERAGSQGQLRNPRAIVKVNDKEVKFMEIEVMSGAPYTADTYYVEMPLYSQPDGIDFAYFSSVEKFSVKIYMGFPADPNSFNVNELVLMIQGESNDVEIDPSEGIVRISGRDLSSRLIDSKVTQSFSNITASELAQQFAKSNNLKQEITPTQDVIGTFLQTAQTYTANNSTQWDMLVQAAVQENFMVYVKGETLVFKPFPSNDDNIQPYVLNYIPKSSSNNIPTFNLGTKISFFKNNIVSGNINVTVKVPYSTYTGKAFHVKQTARNSAASPESIRKYVYSHPGLTYDQAKKQCKQLLNNLIVHSVRFSAELVPDIILSKDMLIRVTGTNTDFDQDYYIDRLVRRMTISDFSMYLGGKNKLDQTELGEAG